MGAFKKSRFTVCAPFEYNGESQVAVYQTMSGGLALIRGREWEAAVESPASLDPGILDLLLEQGMLMKDGIDEDSMLSYWMGQLLGDFSTIKSKIMVTKRCNNKCDFCILGQAEKRDMSRETALAADRFYLQFIAERGAQRVEDQYSGGEPTQNHRIIYESAGRRSSFCWGKGIDYAFSLITNGIQLKRSVVERLKQVGLKRIHVSVAGPADIHDSRRPSKLNGGKSYEIIMGNLRQVSGLVPIVIECQYDDRTSDYLRMNEMLDDLANRSIDVQHVEFTPIMEMEGPAGAGEVDTEKYLYLLRQLKQRGFSPFSEPPSSACSSDFMSRFVFNTEGSFIPCPALRRPHESSLAYGDVSSGIDLLAHSQLRRKIPDKCLRECELFPGVCSGGCRLQALAKTGDFNGIDCRYEMLSQVLKEYMKEKVLSS